MESIIYQGAKKELGSQRSFVPRIGELVLFHRGRVSRLWNQRRLANTIPGVEGEVRREPISNEFKVWDKASEVYRGHPTWLAGYVHCPSVSSELFLPKDCNTYPRTDHLTMSSQPLDCHLGIDC